MVSRDLGDTSTNAAKGDTVTLRRRRHGHERALRLAKAQGLFNLVGGLWPIVALGSFESVFGPKRDDWLQKASGGMFAVTGLTQLLTEDSPEAIRSARRLGVGAALVYLVIDLVYVPAGRIRKTYLLDAAMELGWLIAWARASEDI